MPIYEERRVILQRGAFPAYRHLVLETLWPALAAAGARPLCLLNGLIGAGAEETYSFTGFTDAEAWLRAQPVISGLTPEDGASSGPLRARAALIAQERVRLLLPTDVRPKAETPPGDRRAIYGMRRFTIAPSDWPDFVRHSAEGVWPRIEAQDARILGLFRDAATTEPLEATLLTGYHDPAHWQATRRGTAQVAALDPALREAGERAAAGRGDLTIRSAVRLMTAHWPGG